MDPRFNPLFFPPMQPQDPMYRALNDPFTVMGAGMMMGSDPYREGLGGVGLGVLQAGNVMREQAKLEGQQRRSNALADLQMQLYRAKYKQAESKRLAREQQQRELEEFIASLPPEQRAAARANPQAFATQAAGAAYREEDVSGAQRIFREMGGPAGTGKTFPQWYAEDYKSAGTTVNVGGISEPVRKTMLQQGAMEDALNRYEELLNQYGTETIPGEGKARLSAGYNDVLMQAKEMYNLGALTGPDLELLQKTLTDPTAVSSIFRSKDTFKGQIDELRRKLGASRKRLMQTLPAAQQPTAGGQGGGWQQSPSGARWRAK